MNFKIINGEVFDPETGKLSKRDIFIKDEYISDVEADGSRVIDVKGCIVTTGLIDYHVHFFYRGTENGVNPDAYSFPCGITTAVDAGSTGVANYELYRKNIMVSSDVRIFNALEVASGGQATDSYPENLDPKFFNTEKIKRFFKKYSDNLVGIKTRLSMGIIEGNLAVESLKKTIEIADEVGTRVIVHMTNPGVDLELLANMLRPGDVFCHCYQGKGETILDKDGNVREGIKKAKERGVLFDSSNGKNNFDISVCKSAVKSGLKPDIISSDINSSSFFLQPLHSLPRIMSKYLDFGMSVEEVLETVTINPARAIKREDLASIKVGTVADIAILKVKEKGVEYSDVAGHRFIGERVFVPQLTIKSGKVMYCQSDFC